ncbi:MAG: 4'-phosphopantetheinyl transferase superfamily protein [Pseudomonadota bacterium]
MKHCLTLVLLQGDIYESRYYGLPELCDNDQPMDTLPIDDPQLLPRLENEVHVWLTRPDDVTDPGQLQEYQSLLSPDEQERYRRFHFDRDRHHYLIAHVLLRKTLSAYVDINPSAWQFSNNQHGRPEISAPDIAPLLRFNLTHTNGLVACVVTLELDCGIDVEQLSARGNLMAIAEKMFAASEQQDLMNLDDQSFLDRFFTYWTLREAYCKALGVGIAWSKSDYCFMEDGGDRWGIRFDAPSDEERAHWQFALVRPTTEHLLAVVVRTAGASDKSIVQNFVVP